MHAMRTSYFEWLCDCLLVECVSCGYDRTPLLHTAIFSKYVVVVHHRGSGTL